MVGHETNTVAEFREPQRIERVLHAFARAYLAGAYFHRVRGFAFEIAAEAGSKCLRRGLPNIWLVFRKSNSREAVWINSLLPCGTTWDARLRTNGRIGSRIAGSETAGRKPSPGLPFLGILCVWIGGFVHYCMMGSLSPWISWCRNGIPIAGRLSAFSLLVAVFFWTWCLGCRNRCCLLKCPISHHKMWFHANYSMRQVFKSGQTAPSRTPRMALVNLY